MDNEKIQQAHQRLLEVLAEFQLTPAEHNQLILEHVNGLQNRRRAEIAKLKDEEMNIESEFNALKNDLCNASNLSRV